MFTYNANFTVTRDKVRFLIGDTDSADPQLQDEEISFMLTENPNVYKAAAECCKRIAAMYARKVSGSVDGLSRSFSDRQRHYFALAEDLERRSSGSFAVPYCGGISTADKASVEANSDRVKPAFKRDDMDNPGDTTSNLTSQP